MTRKNGTGSITRDGYIRHSDNELQHRKVWRKYRGEIPQAVLDVIYGRHARFETEI